MADNYQGGFENQDFDEGLDQILEELYEQADVNNQELIFPPENAAQEVEISTESQHAIGHVTNPASADAPAPEGGCHNLPDVSSVRTEVSVTCRPRHSEGKGVKRLRLPEWGTDDVPSTSRLRSSENNEQRYDEGGLTAWSDSMVSAWDRASFSDSASEEETEELPNEDPQELFREHDLNRRLDYDMLHHVNRRFGTLFDLSGQALSYRGAEEIVGNAQSDVGKLLFALCRTCAETQYQGQCQHSDDERIISGVWTSVELSRAIDKGYSVLVYGLHSSRPLLVTDYYYGLPIISLHFHNHLDLVLSADSKIIKMWNKDNGRVFSSIKPQANINDVCLYPGSVFRLLVRFLPG
ncbi:nucleolar protein 10 [Carassius gibelio]|uniref:nucleolar protein 10 n=1 Tax=Carassius gibelio TaxID=101364 RepID=UPI002278F5E8|nr:nucleolar protein 10 [Carassius gibelio]